MPKHQWAAQISETFSVQLPTDAQEWFDAERLPEPPLTTFDQPINPAHIIDPTTPVVWGGQMLPDTLPILSDGAGNVLCLRFGFDNKVSEVIHWDHEGGSWKPYGKSFAEALILDAAFSLINQIDTEESDEPSLEELLPFADWGTAWLSALNGTDLLRLFRDPDNLLDYLSEMGVARVETAQRLCEQHLTSALNRLCRRVGGGKIARMLGMPWSEFRRWLVDPRLIPESQKDALTTITTLPFDELVKQDWEGAAAQARTALSLRTDLAWPFAVLGRAERQDVNLAITYFKEGLRTLGTSEDFVASGQRCLIGRLGTYRWR